MGSCGLAASGVESWAHAGLQIVGPEGLEGVIASLWTDHEAGTKGNLAQGVLPWPDLRNTPHRGMDVLGFGLNLTKVDQTPTVAKALGWVVLWGVRCRCEAVPVPRLPGHRAVGERPNQIIQLVSRTHDSPCQRLPL